MSDEIAPQAAPESAPQPVPDYSMMVMQTLLAGITPEAVRRLIGLKEFLGLQAEQVRALHAGIFVAALTATAQDGWVDDEERERLHGVFVLLRRLGWAPGE